MTHALIVCRCSLSQETRSERQMEFSNFEFDFTLILVLRTFLIAGLCAFNEGSVFLLCSPLIRVYTLSFIRLSAY